MSESLLDVQRQGGAGPRKLAFGIGIVADIDPLEGLARLSTRASARLRQAMSKPGIGKVDTGDLHRRSPISNIFNWDRGARISNTLLTSVLGHSEAQPTAVH